MKPDLFEKIQQSHLLALGIKLQQEQLLEEAIVEYTKRICEAPTEALGYALRGSAYMDLGKTIEAGRDIDQSLELDPESIEANWNKAYLALLCGDYPEGFRLAESRLNLPAHRKEQRVRPGRSWTGVESLKNKTILLYAEQGLGDTLQFIRFANELKNLGAKIYLESQVELVPLLKKMTTLDRVFRQGEETPAVDYQCALLSLPLALGTTLGTIPSKDHYLVADRAESENWNQRLGQRLKPRIGLVWAGGQSDEFVAQQHLNKRRNFPLEKFAELRGLNCSMYSLQKGEFAQFQLGALKRSNWNGPQIIDLSPDLTDFSATAAAIDNLDLVISVDTSVAHLSAAMGKPTWLLNRFDTCWRWLLNRTDSPWYQSIRIYRQPRPGDWDSVIERVERDLSDLIGDLIGDHTGRRARDHLDHSSQNVNHLFLRGVRAHQSRSLDEALACYQGVLEQQPKHAPALHLLGVILATMNDPKKGTELIKSAIELEPSNPEYQNNLGIVLRSIGQHVAATDLFKSALSYHPTYFDAHLNLCKTLVSCGLIPEAFAEYEHALKIHPTSEALCIGLGHLWRDANNHTKAATFYKRAIEINPEFAEAYADLGNLNLTTGNFDTAINCYNKVIELRPQTAAAYSNRGTAQRELGQYERSISSYRLAIEIDPNFADAHSNLAVVFMLLRDYDEALVSATMAIRCRPEHAEAYSNRGCALRELKRYKESIQDLDQSTRLNPKCPHAHFNRGQTLIELKQMKDAIAAFQTAIELKADYSDAYYWIGVAYYTIEDYSKALINYDLAIEINPAHAPAHSGRATILQRLNDLQGAIDSCNTAISLKPNYAEAYSNRGVLFLSLNDPERALTDLRAALALRPDYAQAHSNLGNALQALWRLDEAILSYDAAIAIDPNYAEAYSNRGTAELEKLDAQKSLLSFQKAIELKQDFAEAHSNRGNALQFLGRLDDAILSYQQAINYDPHCSNAHWNMSISLLLKGDLNEGWREYEWRWSQDLYKQVNRKLQGKAWRGEDNLEGKTIFLYAEQGLGDTIQFCRYVPLVASLAAEVVLEVQTPLVNLLRQLSSTVRVVTRDMEIPPYDYHCPLLSLPLAFSTNRNNIPFPSSYLKADPDLASSWATRMGPKCRFRVGLVWEGGTRNHQPELAAVNARRNFPLDKLSALADIDCDFYSLQKGEAAVAQLAGLRSTAWNGPKIIDHSEELLTFSDTAALMHNLDLLISVDTSTAHLAAAMGKPTWILNRYDSCWRWMLDGESSFWYESVRLFRQETQGDWDPVISRVTSELQQRCSHNINHDPV